MTSSYFYFMRYYRVGKELGWCVTYVYSPQFTDHLFRKELFRSYKASHQVFAILLRNL